MSNPLTKDIRFSGLAAVPDQYNAPDGQLDACLNLVPEDAALHPIPQPHTLCKLPEGCKKVILHKLGNASINYLFVFGNSIGWCRQSGISGISQAPDVQMLPLDSFAYSNPIAIMGNTIIISTDESLNYFLWKPDDNNYIALGSLPPVLDFRFTLSQHSSDAHSATTAAIFRNSVIRDDRGSDFGMEGWSNNNFMEWPESINDREVSNALYGCYNKVDATLRKTNCFANPFFVRWAYRLYDGSLVCHSAPILLMHRNVLDESISVNGCLTRDRNNSGDTETRIEFSASSNYYRLCYLLKSIPEDLVNWKDIVHSVDFFISDPAARTDFDCADYSKFRTSVLKPLFDNIGHPVSLTMPSKDDDKFVEGLTSTALFYKGCSIRMDELESSDNLRLLSLEDGFLQTIRTREVMTDDYHSHDLMSANGMKVYNNRLHIFNIRSLLFQGFPIQQFQQIHYDEFHSSDVCLTEIFTTVRTEQGIRKQLVSSSVSVLPLEYDTETRGEGGRRPSSDPEVQEDFPGFTYFHLIDQPEDIWLFYPNTQALAMEIRQTFSDNSVKTYSIPLRKHENLEGAYALVSRKDIHQSDIPPSLAENDTLPVLQPDRLLYSMVDNPFSFPAANRLKVSNGTVLAIETAMQALSQGQFGQFPLYVFTSEGIWAMELSSEGKYKTNQPITRDVCSNPAGITQLDNSVLFTTDRGLMIISGAQTECISDTVKSETHFDLAALPGFSQLRTLASQAIDCFSDIPSLLIFLNGDVAKGISGCGIIYDYVNQRIILYNPYYRFSYMFSLKSRQWCMMSSNIAETVKSYPEALALSLDGNLVSFSETSTPDIADNNTLPSFLLTRPLKLDNPDLLKTVTAVITRGDFARGHVASILYGSRDLRNWHLIRSSVDHYLRHPHGTPYKYFRIALLARLDPDESIAGATIQFTPRLANQPR